MYMYINLEIGGNIGRNSCIIASLLDGSSNLFVFESEPDNAIKVKKILNESVCVCVCVCLCL